MEGYILYGWYLIVTLQPKNCNKSRKRFSFPIIKNFKVLTCHFISSLQLLNCLRIIL